MIGNPIQNQTRTTSEPQYRHGFSPYTRRRPKPIPLTEDRLPVLSAEVSYWQLGRKSEVRDAVDVAPPRADAAVRTIRRDDRRRGSRTRSASQYAHSPQPSPRCRPASGSLISALVGERLPVLFLDEQADPEQRQAEEQQDDKHNPPARGNPCPLDRQFVGLTIRAPEPTPCGARAGPSSSTVIVVVFVVVAAAHLRSL